MTNLGFYFNQDACSGCRACQTACKDRNNLTAGTLFRSVTSYQTGAYPNATMYHISASCNHCEHPACTSSCPTGAMYKAEDGTVQHNDDVCIGCRMCALSCPYGAPQYLEEERIVRKCDSCKPYRDRGENPVCVDACNMRCLDFGAVDELRAKYGAEGVHDLAALPTSEITQPSTIINPREAAKNEDYKVVLL